jgi:hypothetical protein
MKTQTKQLIKSLLKLFLTLCVFTFGYQIGNINKKTEYKTEKILVSDERNDCTSNGGQFSLYFSEFENKYVINCDIPEKNIYREVIN